MVDGFPSRVRQSDKVGGALIRAARPVGLFLYLVLIAGGALFHPRTALLYGAGLGAVGGFIALLARWAPDPLPSLPHPMLAAAVMAGLPAAGAGSTLLGAWSAPVTVFGLTLAAVCLGHGLCSEADSRTDSAAHQRLRMRDEDIVRRMLSAMPTEMVLEEWRGTQGRLHAGTGDRLWNARLRELLIDELETRDPVGTSCWLSAGPDEPPDRYIRGELDLGS